MTRRLISSGSQFEHDIGYSRAVVDGEWVFVSGTTGFDYATMTISDRPVGPNRAVPEEHPGGTARGRRRIHRHRAGDLRAAEGARFPDCWPILRKYFGEIRPAATMISAGLADPRMQIEIEVTARKRAP